MTRRDRYNKASNKKIENVDTRYDKPEDELEGISKIEDDDNPGSTFSFGFETVSAPIENKNPNIIPKNIPTNENRKPFSAMTFDNPKINTPAPINNIASTDPLIDNRMNTGTATKGMTPDIDNEKLSIKRGYQFRESTLRKLNLLKANHPDINVYLNTIIDTAINHYYDYITNHGGKQ